MNRPRIHLLLFLLLQNPRLLILRAPRVLDPNPTLPDLVDGIAVRRDEVDCGGVGPGDDHEL